MSQPTIQPSKSEHWNTPPEVVERVRLFAGGQIALDPCSNEFSNVGAKVALTKEQDGLNAYWHELTEPGDLIFINPPYDKETIEEVAKRSLAIARLFYRDVLLLVPTKSDQDWFQNETLVRARAVCFIKGRVKFWDKGKVCKGGAAFPCCLIWFGSANSTRSDDNFSEAFSSLGRCLKLR